MPQETLQQKPSHAEPPSLSRTSSLVGLWTLISRLLGFARESLLVAVVGVSAVGGALTLAFIIPNLFRRLFGEGAFTAVFLPIYTRTLDRAGVQQARHLVSIVSGALLGLLSSISLLVIAICVFLPRQQLGDYFGALSEQARLTLDYLALLFPYVIFVCAYAMALAILNAKNKFLLPAAAPAIQNLLAIVGLGIVAGLGLQGSTAGYWIAWSLLIAGLLQVVILLPSLRDEQMLVRPRLEVKNSTVREISADMLPLIFGLGLVQINVAVDQVIAVAFLGEGSNQYIHLGNRLLQLPLGILGAGVATVSFPVFARLYAAGTLQTLRIELDKAIRWVLFLAMPAAAGLLALAYPITQVLFEHGEFLATDTARTAPVIMMYAIAIPGLCVVPLLARIYYAAGNTRIPVRISAALVIANVLLSLILVQFLKEAGIALSTTLTAYGNLALLAFLLPRLGLPRTQNFWSVLLRLSAAAGFCGLFAYAIYVFLEQLLEQTLLALLGGIFFGAAIFFLASYLLRLSELKNFLQILSLPRAKSEKFEKID